MAVPRSGVKKERGVELRENEGIAPELAYPEIVISKKKT